MCWKMSMPKMPTITTTARELVPQTESKEPNSPVFGDSDSFIDIAKRRGTQSLKIDSKDKSQYGYNPKNF